MAPAFNRLNGVHGLARITLERGYNRGSIPTTRRTTMEELWRDVRFGTRALLRTPAFTLVAVLTLALGIGANTAIFSVINAILLRPLPYPEADRLVFLTEWSEQVPEMSFSVANFKDVRDQGSVFESIVGYNGQDFILSAVGGSAVDEPERLNGRQVTSGAFATLGKPPILGRGFSAAEDKPGAEGVVLLGEGFWERRFGRDPGVLGRTLVLSGVSHTVIGVMPGGLHGSWKTDRRLHPAPAARGPHRGRGEPGQPPRDLRDRPPEAGGGRRVGPDRGEDDRRAPRGALPATPTRSRA